MNRPTGHGGAVKAGGFTLLEMIFVLGMILVLVTWLTVSIATVETEQRLREAAGDVESLARRARNIAVRQQRAYQLTFSEGAIFIAPQYVEGKDDDSDDFDDFEEDTPRTSFEDIRASEKTDAKVSYEVRRWRSNEWEKIEGERVVVITLDPVGLVEPISIRCSMGESWLVQELHPLTASVRDEEMSIQD